MQVLPDVLIKKLNIVFCGTAAGNKSARERVYYAGSGNQFWRVLKNVGLLKESFDKNQFKTITKYKMGLTDLAKKAAGVDKSLKQEDYDIEGLNRKIQKHKPRYVAFTSKNAAKIYFGVRKVEYGLQKEKIYSTSFYVLPSPSGNACRYWDLGIWESMASKVKKK